METYKNLGGNSSVTAYETSTDHIKVQFKNSPRVYTYSTRRINRMKIEQMKALALAGRGLGAFINQNRDVHDGYDR